MFDAKPESRCSIRSALVLVLVSVAMAGCQNESPIVNPGRMEQESETTQVQFEAKVPVHCRVVFGPDRSQARTASLVGNSLFFDVDGDGNIRNENERFKGMFEAERDGKTVVNFPVGDIRTGETLYANTNFRIAFGEEEIYASVSTLVDGKTPAAASSLAFEMKMEEKLEESPLVHFGGQLTMGFDHHPTQLIRGQENDFYVQVGSLGIGNGTLAAVTHTSIPKDAHPRYEFHFPNSAGDEEPIVVIGYLDQRC